MTFQCEDLRNFGLLLVPPSLPDYEPLLADIQYRIDHPPPEAATIPERLRRLKAGTISPEKRATSAILLNQSEKSIAALALIWRYEEADGRTYSHSSTNVFGQTLLLPFGGQASLKLAAYWNTILPGSKRYLGENEMAGDNTDVRLPAADEIRTGGGFGSGSGLGHDSRRLPKSVTLVLDGVFFTDGEFAGPNQLGLWDRITLEAKMRMNIAKIARDGKNRGDSASEVLEKIGMATGPASGRPPAPRMPVLQRTPQLLANHVERQRQHLGDERTVDTLAEQADTQLPNFRKQ